MIKWPKPQTASLVVVVLVFALANLLTIGPDLYKAANTPTGKWFTGQASWFDPWDINVYLSAIGWGKRGGILLENPYDTETAPAAPIYTLYTILGKIARPFNQSNTGTFRVASIVSDFLLAAVVWWFVKMFLKERLERLAAFSLVFLGGGLGWLFFPKISARY